MKFLVKAHKCLTQKAGENQNNLVNQDVLDRDAL